MVKSLLEIIDGLEKQVKELERILGSLVAGDRVVELIRSIPGSGLITAARWSGAATNSDGPAGIGDDPFRMTDPYIVQTVRDDRCSR